MNQTYNPKSTKKTRKKLRNNLTTPELLLWQRLKAKQFNGLKFRRQNGILNYVVDFYCPSKKLIIEIDGETHYQRNSKQFDKKRQREIETLGFHIIRYTNRQIMTNIDGVLSDIEKQLNLQPPQPLLTKEGKREALPLPEGKLKGEGAILPLSEGELEGEGDPVTFIIKQNQTKTITKGGSYTIKLIREGASVNIHGAFWLKDKDKLDLNVTIIHKAKNTSSNTTLKAIADDDSTVNLNGTIIVEKGAQLTNAFLSEKILLYSQKATAHAIPNLEISSHDIKCSHAATISSIDEDQLFYLRSRGLSKAKAKHLIAQGFINS